MAGTIGHKVLGGAKKIEIDKKVVNVKLSVQYMSFRCVRISCECSMATGYSCIDCFYFYLLPFVVLMQMLKA